jgi:hypothetical protein
MALHDLLAALQHSQFGIAISGSSWMFPTIETAHVFALAAVVGSIAIVDLRLMGLTSTSESATRIIDRYTPWTWWAFLAAALSGGLLFVSRAADYGNLPVFWMKYGYMAAAGLNMAYFHFATQRTMDRWDLGAPPIGARVAGALSLFFWASVVICARRIGFHM